MRVLAIILGLCVLTAGADQKMHSREGWCHAVDPRGIDRGIEGFEIFMPGCQNLTMSTNPDSTQNGSYLHKVRYPGALPFTYSYYSSGESGVPCRMVRTDGVVFVTLDWDASYTVVGNEIEFSVDCRNGNRQ